MNVINDSIDSSEVDLIVIPHSTAGTVSASFSEILKKISFDRNQVPKGDLGQISIQSVKESGKWRYLCFVCSVNDFTSTYPTIYKIIKNLALSLPKEVKTVSIPLIGAGAGGLEPHKIFLILRNALKELIPKEIEISLYVFEKPLFSEITKYFEIQQETKSVMLVFDFSLDEIENVSWVQEQLKMKEFYFELARKKYDEFLTHSLNIKEYQQISHEFRTSKTVFSKFLYKYPEGSPIYTFLLLCGELIAYIDRHAYNKNVWNKYSDKRTLARSSVNQTRWVQYLLDFKAGKHDYTLLSDSVKNALLYLHNPSQNLTMLSSRHRSLVAKTFFNVDDQGLLLVTINNFFLNRGFLCSNTENNGSLYSRILYITEIKELWLESDDNDTDYIEFTTTINRPTELTDEGLQTEVARELIRKRNLRLLMHSDMYAKVDLLNYEIYASIIARLITSKLSAPPFNISIMAPWGKGKTSLMRFIEQKLNFSRGERRFEPAAKYSDLKVFLWSLLPSRYLNIQLLDNPVIWFNAWKFQKSEQVWAGLADEIIKQLADQYSPFSRQKFWFKLNIKRVETNKIAWDLGLNFFRKVIFPLGYLLIAGLFSYLFSSIDWHTLFPALHAVDKTYITSIPAVVGVIAAVQKLNLEWRKAPDFDISKFVSRPEYRSKTGYLQEVEDDLKRAIEIAINPDRPAVIFIDDLDRCSPTVIAEVVEAINAFMSGELSKCYFIIGQDPMMVTASLDSAYEKIAGKIGKMEGQHTSIGRYFLEKFTQLTINIPVMNDDIKKTFIESLLSSLDEGLIPELSAQKELLDDYKKLQRDIQTSTELNELFSDKRFELEEKIRLFDSQLVVNFQEAILGNAFDNYKMDDNELENIIAQVADYFDSPRTIKRFLNLFLFYHFLKYTIAGRKLVDIDYDIMASWILIMVRWPLLVQAVQWNTENAFVKGGTCLERAEQFDKLILSSNSYEEYVSAFKVICNTQVLTWQIDEHLYKICKGKEKKMIKIGEIVKSGIW